MSLMRDTVAHAARTPVAEPTTPIRRTLVAAHRRRHEFERPPEDARRVGDAPLGEQRANGRTPRLHHRSVRDRHARDRRLDDGESHAPPRLAQRLEGPRSPAAEAEVRPLDDRPERVLPPQEFEKRIGLESENAVPRVEFDHLVGDSFREKEPAADRSGREPPHRRSGAEDLDRQGLEGDRRDPRRTRDRARRPEEMTVSAMNAVEVADDHHPHRAILSGPFGPTRVSRLS